MKRRGAYETSSRQPHAVSEAVGAFCKEMVRLRAELQAARSEIERLKKELAEGNASRRRRQLSELRSLRRQIAFCCHPDRGGDVKLMQRVNTLFDYLESSPELFAEAA